MSKIKSKIRQDISQVFNILIPQGKWAQYLEMLDRDGHPNRKELMSLVLVFSQHIEELEDHIEELYFQVGLLEGNNEKKTIPVEIKLRTPDSIWADLEKIRTPQSTKYYVSENDWKVLEKNVNPDLAQKNPEHGFGKEIDTKDGKEKTCLYYKGLPIFKK